MIVNHFGVIFCACWQLKKNLTRALTTYHMPCWVPWYPIERPKFYWRVIWIGFISCAMFVSHIFLAASIFSALTPVAILARTQWIRNISVEAGWSHRQPRSTVPIVGYEARHAVAAAVTAQLMTRAELLNWHWHRGGTHIEIGTTIVCVGRRHRRHHHRASSSSSMPE